MLHENLKSLRKSKGISQEELAGKLNVVRQTISKWEKGMSVPDSELLIKIAEVFEVSVSELLGKEIPTDTESKNDISDQLQRINEQLAVRNRRSKTVMKVILGVVAGIILINLLLMIFSMAAYTSYMTDDTAIVETYNEEAHIAGE